MSSTPLTEKAKGYLHKLCVEIPNRRVGSEGNPAATDFFAQTVAAFGFETATLPFDCIDWRSEGVRLTAHGETFTAPLAVVSTVEALAASELSGRIVLLRGEIAREQLMPKNFPFYNPDRHRHILQVLEARQPLAIIAGTTRDVQMTGSLYPFPLIEDGDLDIPSVYMTEAEGERLAGFAGHAIALASRAARLPATGCNVIARKSRAAQRRVVLFAHIDAKPGTPGALDNASGVAVLLILAERLASYAGPLGIEMVALNGEDYFSSPGEQQYLAHNAGSFDDIVLGINVDGVGYRKGRVAYSL